MKKLIVLFVIIIIVGALGFWGPLNSDHFNHHSLMEELEHHEFAGSILIDNDEFINKIDTAEFIKVHSSRSDIKNFFTQFRTKDLVSFPCQNCHSSSLEELKSDDLNKRNAHWNVELKHADISVMNCMTCHNGNNMNMLNSLQGNNISIDRSFELCGQCHSSQLKDWKGGAHGKNTSGWNSQRIVKTCVSCHNPHDPSIKSRWPSRLTKEKNNKDESNKLQHY